MPETNVLYSVTAAVVVGLVAWVAVVLKSAKEPWARAVPPATREREADVPLEGEAKEEEVAQAVEAEKKPDAEVKPETEAGPEAEAEAEVAKTEAAK